MEKKVLFPLTDKEFSLLCQLSYLPIWECERCKSVFVYGERLGNIALKFYTNKRFKVNHIGGMSDRDYRTLLLKVISNRTLRDLVYIAFYNDNIDLGSNPFGTGFVGILLQNKKTKDCIFVFRGSEGRKEMMKEGVKYPFLTVDWMDNFGLGTISYSKQFDKVKSFIQEKSEGICHHIYVTGHSKGGANALYAAAVIDGVRAIAFNSPGISQCLTQEQKNRLIQSHAVNYITEGDLVGPLLFHTENVFYVKTVLNDKIILYKENKEGTLVPIIANYNNPIHHHYLQSFYYDDEGYITEGERTIWSFISENMSKLLYMLNYKMNGPVTDLYIALQEYLELYQGQFNKRDIANLLNVNEKEAIAMYEMNDDDKK